jgi:acyl carrier protein
MSFEKEEVQKSLLTIVRDILNKDVNPDDNFEELGGQSIEMQDILSIVYRKYQLKIKLKDVLNLRYIDDIIEHIWSKLDENK